MITHADDPINHENRLKFVAFLADANQESAMRCRRHLDVRFNSFRQDFLNQLLQKDQHGLVVGIKDQIDSKNIGIRFHSGATFDSHKLTLLKHIAVCIRTLPSTPVDSHKIYVYNLWYDYYKGNRMAYIGKKWLRIKQLRRHQVLDDSTKYRHGVLEPAIEIRPRDIHLHGRSSEYLIREIHHFQIQNSIVFVLLNIKYRLLDLLTIQ